MAPPLVAAAIPIGAKILGLAKGLVGGSKAAAGIKAAAGLGGGAMGPMSASTIGKLAGVGKGAYLKRMAGDALGKAGSFIGSHTPKSLHGAAEAIVGKELMSRPADLAFRLAPDAAFGVLGAAMTPGDPLDKAIAGGTQFLGGGLTGIALGRGARAMGASQRVADLVDMGGSVVGDMGGMMVGDSIMRVKGGGMTPYERMAEEQDEAYRQQLIAELQSGYGLV